ncbi:MAG: DNA primase, partial [Rhodobiaceae bacterium]|nr:DNA primase [Rhodobiaceae bacterium]
FALLPEGQDPDDVLRNQGREALANVLGATRSLVDVVWAQAVESQPHDTPERRAALEARLGGLVRTVGDETVRRHYGQEIARRTADLFGGGNRAAGRAAGWGERRGEFQRGRGGLGANPGRAAAVGASDSLKRSALVTGARDMPRRETVMLLTLVNHPALIADVAEELCEIALSHPELERLRAALVDAAAEGIGEYAGAADPDVARRQAVFALRESLRGHGLAALLERIDSQSIARTDWFAGAEAADADAESGLKHTMALHRKINTLHRNLEIAQADFERDICEANEARVFAIKAELEKAEGTEALVQGFGAHSGRPVRNF